MAFEEDLSLFFDTSGFAVDAQATDAHGELVQFQVFFDQPHADGLGVMESTNPSVLGRSVDLDDVPHMAQVLIGDQAWIVVGHQPDGTGVTRLLLEPAS